MGIEDYELQRTGSLCQPPQHQLLEHVKINHIPKIKAIVLENPELVSTIYGHPFNKPILHIACYEFADRILPQTINVLLDLQANLYYSDDINNHKEALHFAVLGGNPNIIQVIIRRLGPNKINAPCGGGSTALNLLIKEGNIQNVHFLDNIRVLIRAGIDVNKPDDKNLTPIFWAAKKGYKEAVRVILHESKQNVDIDNHTLRGKSARDYMDDSDFVSNNNETASNPHDILFGYLKQFNEDAFVEYKNLSEYVNADDGIVTLLQFAVKKGFAKAVDTLLAAGGDPNRTTQKTKETALELAAIEGFHVIFDLLLNNDKTNISNNVLIELLKHIDSDITHIDVNHNLCYESLMKCKSKIKVNCPDQNKSTPLHYAARYGGPDKVLDLLRCGSSLACRNKFGNLPVEDIDANTLETHFDECVETNLENNIDKENATVIFNYKTILPPAKTKYNDDNPKAIYDTEAANKLIMNEIEQLTSETQVISFISKSTELRHLLKHPLLTSFIYMKWHRVRWFFYTNLVFYIIFCLSLILFTLLCYGTRNSSILTIILRALLGTTFTLFILRELFQIAVSPKTYFLDVENWIEVTLIALSGVILFDHSPSDDVTRQVSAFAILLAAFEMVLLIGQHPKMSTNIVMLRTVSVNFFKFLLWYSVLIIAFALSFYTLFKHKAKSGDEQDFFVDPAMSLFKTIVMLTGEFDASDIQFQVYPITSHIIFMLFVFMIAIVLFNLLNGLAVSDTQLIKSNAELVGHIARIEHVAYLESMLLGNVLPVCCLQTIQKYCCCLPVTISSKITAPGILVKRVCLFPYFLKDYKMVIYPNKYGRIVCKQNSDDGNGSCIARCTYIHLDKQSVKRTKHLIRDKKDALEKLKNRQIALEKQEEVLQQQQKYIEELKSQQQIILNKLDYIITNRNIHN